MLAKCLCEKIQFTFTPVDGTVIKCFCSLCRRSHGADYATQVISSKDSLTFLSGEALLSEFASSQFGIRAFCSHCGSRLMNYASQGSRFLSVALSAVVDDHHLTPRLQINVASKADWVVASPDLPAEDGVPGSLHKYF